jgi:hypothetical protein
MKQIAHIDNCIVSEMSTWQMILLILKLINWQWLAWTKVGQERQGERACAVGQQSAILGIICSC